MQIAVLVEPLANQRFRARSGEPLGLSSEGETPQEAVERLRQLIAGVIDQGAFMCVVDVPAQESPWQRLAGMLKDDPLGDDLQQAMAEYRRSADSLG